MANLMSGMLEMDNSFLARMHSPLFMMDSLDIFQLTAEGSDKPGACVKSDKVWAEPASKQTTDCPSNASTQDKGGDDGGEQEVAPPRRSSGSDRAQQGPTDAKRMTASPFFMASSSGQAAQTGKAARRAPLRPSSTLQAAMMALTDGDKVERTWSPGFDAPLCKSDLLTGSRPGAVAGRGRSLLANGMGALLEQPGAKRQAMQPGDASAKLDNGFDNELTYQQELDRLKKSGRKLSRSEKARLRREKNRLAARKCRQKKQDNYLETEAKAKSLQAETEQLRINAEQMLVLLRKHVTLYNTLAAKASSAPTTALQAALQECRGAAQIDGADAKACAALTGIQLPAVFQSPDADGDGAGAGARSEDAEFIDVHGRGLAYVLSTATWTGQTVTTGHNAIPERA